MNIFYLSHDVDECARFHVDKHVVKMILESAQLLSTAHRVLDGEQATLIVNGREKKTYLFAPEYQDDYRHGIYQATHINHPSSIWARKTNNNYNWLFCLFNSLCREYTYRYGKIHKCESLMTRLDSPPRNIDVGYFTQPTLAMPDEYKISADAIECYRAYYRGAKTDFARWTKRPVPEWFMEKNNVCLQS